MDNGKAPVAQEFSVTRYRKGEMFPFTHKLVIEEPLEIRLESRPFVTLMRTPGMEKELVIGFCFTEGLIDGMSDVALLEHCGSASEKGAHNVANVRLTNPSAAENLTERNIVARTGCGICGKTVIENIVDKIPKLDSSVRIDSEIMATLHEKMTAAQKIFNFSGATHAAAIFTSGGDMVTCAEDLGRHNALDKIIGYCLMRGIPTEDKIVVLSGRSSYELIMKAARAKVSIVASISAPTLLAVELSQRINCTLVGFLRDEGFNIYTFPDRIRVKGSKH